MEFEAINGWYSLHLFWKFDWHAYRQVDANTKKEQLKELNELIKEFEEANNNRKGSYALGRVIGHKSDFAVMILHEDIAQLTEWQDELKRLALFDEAELNVSYLSVNEVTNYLVEKLSMESDYVQNKLYPTLNDEKYFCFYPMSRKREWFSLPMSERQRMLGSHGQIGASYKDEITGHYVTNSVGLDDYEWGVTLWSDKFDAFKDIIYEMRFDESSAKYGVFPYFILGEQLHKNALNRYFIRSDRR